MPVHVKLERDCTAGHVTVPESHSATHQPKDRKTEDVDFDVLVENQVSCEDDDSAKNTFGEEDVDAYSVVIRQVTLAETCILNFQPASYTDVLSKLMTISIEGPEIVQVPDETFERNLMFTIDDEPDHAVVSSTNHVGILHLMMWTLPVILRCLCWSVFAFRIMPSPIDLGGTDVPKPFDCGCWKIVQVAQLAYQRTRRETGEEDARCRPKYIAANWYKSLCW